MRTEVLSQLTRATKKKKKLLGGGALVDGVMKFRKDTREKLYLGQKGLGGERAAGWGRKERRDEGKVDALRTEAAARSS